MRRLLVFATMFVVLIALLITVVRGIGLWLGPEAIASGIVATDGCALPCWRGIQAGHTTLSEAIALLKADKPFIESVYQARQGTDVPSLDDAICWSIAVTPSWSGCAGHGVLEAGPVTQVELTPPLNVFTLGEAIALFDNPVAVEMCRQSVSVYFAHDVEVVVSTGKIPRLDPRQTVFLVRFLYPGTEPPYRFDTPPWRGFITWQSDITC